MTRSCNHTTDSKRFRLLLSTVAVAQRNQIPDTLLVDARTRGPDRSSRAWPWQGIEKGGGTLAFGGELPVVTLNTFPGVETAVTRQTTEGNPPGGWIREQRISLADTIKACRVNAAFAAHREKAEGSLEPGKRAGLIVLGEDVFQVPAGRLSETEVMLTIFGGKVVYQASTWATACCSDGGHE